MHEPTKWADERHALQARVNELETNLKAALQLRDALTTTNANLRAVIKQGKKNTQRLLEDTDKEILSLQKVVDTAQAFINEIQCYSAGVALMAEEDMVELFAAYSDAKDELDGKPRQEAEIDIEGLDNED